MLETIDFALLRSYNGITLLNILYSGGQKNEKV